MVFGPPQSLPEQLEDSGQQLGLALTVEEGMTNQVKSIAKDTFSGTLMLFHSNGFDPMSPSTHMVGPTKCNGSDRK